MPSTLFISINNGIQRIYLPPFRMPPPPPPPPPSPLASIDRDTAVLLRHAREPPLLCCIWSRIVYPTSSVISFRTPDTDRRRSYAWLRYVTRRLCVDLRVPYLASILQRMPPAYKRSRITRDSDVRFTIFFPSLRILRAWVQRLPIPTAIA